MVLQNLHDLESAYSHGWILSTKQVAELLGISPKVISRSESLERHGFAFSRDGQVGTEIGWRVGKVAELTRKSNRRATRA